MNNFINQIVAHLPDRGPKQSSFLFYALIGLSKDFIPQEWNSRKSQKSHSRLFFFSETFFLSQPQKRVRPNFPFLPHLQLCLPATENESSVSNLDAIG